MTIDDYDAVYACWMSCTGMGLNTIDDSRDGIAKYLARNPTTCFVDERDGRITGVIIAGHDGRRGYIYHTAISPDHRHQGIGTALVVFARNADGNAFWQRLGFTSRDDLTYRNKALAELTRIDT